MKLTVLKKSSLNSHDFNKVKLKEIKEKRASEILMSLSIQLFNFEWMNERTNEWMNERMNEWTNERMNECGKTIFKLRDY